MFKSCLNHVESNKTVPRVFSRFNEELTESLQHQSKTFLSGFFSYRGDIQFLTFSFTLALVP